MMGGPLTRGALERRGRGVSEAFGTTNAAAHRQRLPVPTGQVDGHITLPRVVSSEWLKFRSLRSTVLVLFAAMLAMVVFGAIIGHNTRHPTGLDPEDVVASGPLQGYYLGQLLIGSLGVLVVSGEYSSGMIGVVGLAMVAASVAGFLVAQAFLSGYRPTYSLSDPDVLRVVVGTGVYLTLIGLLGGAIGWIVRSTPGSLIALFAVILVLPVLLLLFHGAWAQHAGAWLPTGASFSTSLRMPDTLAPWPGLAVMVGWVVVAYVVAGVLLHRRDA